ncbi:MAG: globin [Pseudomonadales bacterium]
MSDTDPVTDTLDAVAQQDIDLTDPVLDHYATRRPESAALMAHMDEYMKGRMMADVLMLLMTPPAEVDHQYLTFEVESHRAYGVTIEQFPDLLASVRDSVREVLGDAWDAAAEQAWGARISAHMDAIRAVATS